MPKPSLLQEEKKRKKESLFISTITELGERKRHAGLHSNSKITTTVSNKSLCIKPVLSAHTHTHIYIMKATVPHETSYLLPKVVQLDRSLLHRVHGTFGSQQV